MRLICDRPQLTGNYGPNAAQSTVLLGQQFEASDDLGRHLIQNGLAHRADPPKVLYETKVVTPEAPEVSPRLPFHNLPLHHEEQAGVATESNPMLPGSDLPTPRTLSRLGRRGRARLGSAR